MADGSPAFPNQVIGTWTCDGYLVSDGMRTETGTIVITRQIIRFTDGDLLITQGPELADVEVPVVRAVTGGTGEYATAPAEIRQTLLGMSDGYGVRLQMELGLQQDAQLLDFDDTRPGNQSLAAQEAERAPFEQGL
jgi:hypothetical protein